MSGPLAGLPVLRDARSRRASSWDRTGGNRDFITVPARARARLAELHGPGVIRHFWLSTRSDDPLLLRRAIVRAYWDGESEPSIEVPIGDFFGVGHARSVEFVSMPLQMAPQDGRSLHCWFPMPYRDAIVAIDNDSDQPFDLYFHIDYEESIVDAAILGRFHAQWRRTPHAEGIDETGMSNEEFQFEGTNLTGDQNIVILEAEGHGHYVGCVLAVRNLRTVGEGVSNWYGEGDDMIFIDGDSFPPSLHGTGTEEYAGLAWGPREAFTTPYYGLVLPGGSNWSGEISMYRFHIEDPIRFEKSIRVTIEHGHANRRSDDYSSTAFWYQTEPHAPFPELPSEEDRLPRSDAG